MSLIGLLASTEKNGPRGTTPHEALPVSPKGALEISSVAGQPPSLDRSHLCTPGLASNEGWGAHLEQSSTRGLWSPQEKRLYINVLELKAVSLALRHFNDQCQDQTVLVATDNSTVVAYINKQGGTHSAQMCALLWRIMTWCHHFHITLKARHIYKSKWALFEKWCRKNSVDFSTPSVKQIKFFHVPVSRPKEAPLDH